MLARAMGHTELVHNRDYVKVYFFQLTKSTPMSNSYHLLTVLWIRTWIGIWCLLVNGHPDPDTKLSRPDPQIWCK